MTIELQNPHSVLAVLDTRAHDVLEIRTSTEQPSPAWQRVLTRAEECGIPISGLRTSDSSRRKGRSHSGDGGRQSSSRALVRERKPLPLNELFQELDSQSPSLWLALDCLQDPHNVGAVFRSAAFFGVKGAVLTRDRSAPLNATVYDIATGGLEYVPFAHVANLSQALKQARKAGVWILGSSEHADRDITEVDRFRPWLLVIGNEERGLRRLTLEHCDEVCAIHPRGHVTSLNVSVAAGSMMAIMTSDGLSDASPPGS